MITVRIDTKVRNEALKKLMDFGASLSDSFTLSRYYEGDLPEEIRQKVDGEYEEIMREEDRQSRQRFKEDEEYRKDMLAAFGTEEKVYAYFDEVLEESLNLYEFDEEPFEDFEEEDEELFEEDFDITGLFEDGELTEEDFLVVSEEELEEDEEDEEFEDIDYDTLRVGPYETDRKDYLESWYTRQSYVTLCPLFEMTRFSMGDTLAEVSSKMKHLFSFPILLDETAFEDLAFHRGDRVLMAVCSHERFCHLDLTEEEYDRFKNLNIPHVVEE